LVARAGTRSLLVMSLSLPSQLLHLINPNQFSSTH